MRSGKLLTVGLALALITIAALAFAQTTPTSTAGPTAKFAEYFKKPFDAKYGGIFRWGGRAHPAMYDFHQSPTHHNLTAQQVMFNTLLQFDPRDGGRTIVPDLAYAWEESPDGLEYTFYLRDDVYFHHGPQFTCGPDGPPFGKVKFTADDVVATYQRIIWPPQGMVSMRKELMVNAADVRKVEKIDDYTVKFTLGSPRAAFIPSVAHGWNMIVSKKFLDCYNNDIRREPFIPGTGAFMLTAHSPGESWTLKKNPDYFVKHLPYFDGIEITVLTDAAARAAAVYGGKVDAAMQIVPDDLSIAKRNPDKYYIQIVDMFNNMVALFNVTRPPFNDARVRRAINLVCDKEALAAVTGETNWQGGPPGGWFWPEWQTGGAPWGRTPDELAQVPGFRKPTAEDIAEAKRLMAEAGYPEGQGLSFHILQRGTSSKQAVAIQYMVKKALAKAEVTIRTTDDAVYFDDVTKRNFDMTTVYMSAEILDPSPWLNKALAPGGSYNYGGWDDAETNALLRKIDTERDQARRVELVRQMQTLLDRKVPIMMFGYHGGADVIHKYLGGPGLVGVEYVYGGYNSLNRRWEHMWFVKPRGQY